MAGSRDKYQAVLAAHLDVNRKSWTALQERGVDETTPLQLDFEFTAEDEAATRALMRFLREHTDYEFKGGARDQEDGSRRWMVLGETSPMTLSLEGLDAWVTRMTEYGREGGPAVFDGWGARVSDPKPAARKPTLAQALRGRRKKQRS